LGNGTGGRPVIGVAKLSRPDVLESALEREFVSILSSRVFRLDSLRARTLWPVIELIEPARFDIEVRLGAGKSDDNGRGGKAEDGGEEGKSCGGMMWSSNGRTSSSARVDSAAPVLATLDVAELSHVLPDTLLELDSRGRADLDEIPNSKSSIT
jgi:hypothetical protein